MIPYSAMENDEPVQVFPWMNYALIALNFLVFFFELALGNQGAATLNKFILDYSLVPCEYTGHCAAYAGTPNPFWVTLFTSMFMHAGWAHILGNMLFLWVFGGHIERSMGHLRYLAFYLIGGVVAMLAQVAASPSSTIPNLGASGAIAAVMGAFLVTYPRDKIRTLLVIFVFVRVTLVPAALLIGLWFLVQLVNVGAVATAQTGGVAYLAHIGGIVYGALTGRLFEDPKRVAARPTYGELT